MITFSRRKEMERLKITAFGFGAVGQVLGLALQRSQHATLFLDKSGNTIRARCLVEKISRDKISRSTVAIRTPNKPRQHILNSDVIFVSVRYENVHNVALFLKPYLPPHRRHYPVTVFFENYFAVKNIFRRVLKKYPPQKLIFGIPDFVAIRTGEHHARVSDPFRFILGSESATSALANPHFIYRHNIREIFFQKLYTKNAAHAVVAYLAVHRGYRHTAAALQDQFIHRVMKTALREIAVGLKHGLGIPRGQVAQSMREVKNIFLPGLSDLSERGARNPIKKLGSEERLVFPALLAYQSGLFPTSLCQAIAHLLKYRNETDSESIILSTEAAKYGAPYVLRKYAKIPRHHPISIAVDRFYRKITPRT